MPPKKVSTAAGATDTGGGGGTGGSKASGGTGTPPPSPEVTPPVSVSSTGVTKVAHTPVIAKIIWLCDFPDDSTMVRFIDQQQWTKLFHVTTIGIDEVKDSCTTSVKAVNLPVL
jgi:hypothetical protein